MVCAPEANCGSYGEDARVEVSAVTEDSGNVCEGFR